MFCQAVKLDAGDPKRSHIALSWLIPLSKLSDENNVSDVHFASTGEWRGHPAGPFKITANDIDAMVNAFNAQVNPVAIDYDHKSLSQFTPPESAKASGWIHSLERRDTPDGAQLWGSVEWTQPAADMIRAGEYRFISPVIDPYPIDRVSGEAVSGCEMMGAALTNNPFFDGQAPVQLTRFALTDAPADPAADPATTAADNAADKTEPAAEAKTDPAETLEPAEPVTAAESPNDPYVVGMTAFVDSMMSACNLDRGSMVNAFAAYQSDIASVLVRNLQRDKPAQRAAFTRDKGNVMTTEQKTEDKGATQGDKVTEEPATATPANESNEARMLRVKLEAQADEIERLRKNDEARGKREAEQEAKRIDAHVDSLIAAGRMKKTQRDNAIWAFTTNWAQGEEIFGKAQALVAPPVAGEDPHDDVKPVADPAKATAADLTAPEREMLRAMTRGGSFKPEDCVRHIVANRSQLASQRRAMGLPD